MADVSSHMWYVSAGGRVWGPYPEARVAGFVAEGRVRADTPVSPWSRGPFAPAEDSAEFAPLFRTPSPAPSGPPSAPPPTASRAVPAPARTAPALVLAGPARPLLIWAEVDAARIGALHAALAGLGPGATIRPGLWLVQARAGPAAVRNHLSLRLGGDDRLLIVEASLEQAAWFNLGRDHELRRLWSAPPAPGAPSSAKAG